MSSRNNNSLGISAPPSSGKSSRRESVEKYGRGSGEDSPSSRKSSSSVTSPPGRDRSSSKPPSSNLFSIPDENTSNTSKTTTTVSTASLFDFFDPLAVKSNNNNAQDPFSNDFAKKANISSKPSQSSATNKPKPKPKKEEEEEEEDEDSEEDEEEEDEDEDDDSEEEEEEEEEEPKKNNKKATSGKGSKAPVKERKPVGEMVSAARTNTHLPGKPEPSSTKPSGPPVLKVDVLSYMKKGTPFLKYGKQGYPHFRQFQLSDDNGKIVWFSQAKKLKDTQVDLLDVDEIRLGQTTAVFARHKAPELAKSSFSIIYDHGKSSLDLIAKDPNEFKIWTEGLRELTRRAKSGRIGELESLKTLVLEIGVHAGRRSSVDITDVTSGKNADMLAPVEEIEAQQARARAASTGNKQLYKDVAKNFSALKAKLAKRKEEMREQQYYMSPTYENMQVIVKRVGESVVKINDWFQDGEYALCDDEIWRAGVDLESLKNMMKAVKQ